MRQSSELEPLSEAQTEAALHRSRDFLRQRLVPDVERAEVRIRSLEDDKGRYEQLIGELDGHSYDRARLAPLGMGIHVPVTVEPKELIIVSMGLSTVSETAWSRSQSDEQQPAEQQPLQKPDSSTADAGLYAELTIDQARTFSQRKVAILQKKINLARERHSLIQGHIELTSKSIQQLEALQQNPSANFLDHLS